ncbi:Gfo/Idh/MocA family protein [Tessaracoccus sp. Z1128]
MPTHDTTGSNAKALRIAMIGSGLMAKSHTLGFRNVEAVYGELPLKPELSILIDANEKMAEDGARTLGYAKWGTDWRDAVADPDIDLVDIVTPNWLHFEIAMAAIAAGKDVYCEKPLALTAADAETMYLAAKEAGVRTIVGFNYVRNPAIEYAKELISSGALGDIWAFKATFALDAVTDPSVPFTWRFERARAGSGALGDLGAHIVALAHELVGPIKTVSALSTTVITERPEPAGVFGYGTKAAESAPLRQVENDDIIQFLAQFASGAVGTFEASRVATGRAYELAVEVTGSKGALRFTQQDAYKLELYLAEGDELQRGFRDVPMGPGHGDYGKFWPFAGAPLGVHELKVIEIHELIDALSSDRDPMPGFEDAWRVSVVLDAVEESAAGRRWVDVPGV